MAHPKRKQSRARSRKRRTHQTVARPQLVECTECKRLKPGHMVCPFCGYYSGREVMSIVAKEKKKTR
ncbi:MAG: 50S ribosomal protein L32 [Candidatus Omnitrophica bacterium]|nr:50S ribosomal protein L32 [Candidatus Omnitrophota bacterium]